MIGTTQIGNNTSTPIVSCQSIRQRPANTLITATGSATRCPTPDERHDCNNNASPLMRVIRSPVVDLLKKRIDSRLRLRNTATRRSLITRSLAHARQYAPRNLVEPRKPTSKGNTNSPPTICIHVRSSPILGSHGSSVPMTLVWMEAAVSVNQLPGSATSFVPLAVAATVCGSSRSRSVLVAHSTRPLDAPKSTPKKSPASSRPQYGFT